MPFIFTQYKAMEKQTLIETLQQMAKTNKKPSELLRYLVLEIKQEQQLELMILFTEAFDCTLGEVTAIGGWWHDDSAELNDTDIDAYISPLINHWLANQLLDQKKRHPPTFSLFSCLKMSSFA